MLILCASEANPGKIVYKLTLYVAIVIFLVEHCNFNPLRTAYGLKPHGYCQLKWGHPLCTVPQNFKLRPMRWICFDFVKACEGVFLLCFLGQVVT